MAKFDYDCSGWATKAKTKCYDGLTIAPNAFQECDGKVVTMVYNHDHDNLENVLGHCLLENRPGGHVLLRKVQRYGYWPDREGLRGKWRPERFFHLCKLH